MHILRKPILIGLTTLSLGAAAVGAHAQAPENRSTHAAAQEQRQAKMAAYIAKREAKLHDVLKLTSAQEPAWAAFTSAIKPEPKAERLERADWAKLTTPQRLEKMIALSKERTARMEAHLAGLNTFYATLTPEQQKIFDKHSMHEFAEMGRHRMTRG
jgi:Spy/CpxP family protein refolding chaperone